MSEALEKSYFAFRLFNNIVQIFMHATKMSYL